MKTWGLVVLLVLACVTPSAGQTPKDDQEHAIRQGRIKMWTGIVMVAAGAAVMPVTAVTSNDGTGAAAVAAAGLMGAGGAVIYWGSRQQQKAVRPSIAFGMSVGKSRSGLVIRRSW
jgi:hypothetical protein